MRFIYDNEVEAWAAEHGLRGTEERPLRTLLYHDDERRHRRMWYDPGTPETAEPIAAMIRGVGEWDEAVLWLTRWLAWPSSENWPAYYAARGARGELRSIDDTPGHLFKAGEQAALVEFATFALRNGWDAFVLTATGGRLNPVRLRISHDEFVELQSSDAARVAAAVDRAGPVPGQ